MIKSFTAKLGNMRKAVSWVVCPVSNADPDTVYIQCNKRICRFNTKTGKGLLSAPQNYPGFHALYIGATEITVPQEVIDAATGAAPKSGDQIGPGVFVA